MVVFIFIWETVRAGPAPDFSHSIQKAVFVDSCRELLTRGLNREGKKRPFLWAHPATEFFSWRKGSISSQPASENWAQTTVRITKAREMEKTVINVVASRSSGATRHASCLDTVVGLTVVCGLTRGNKKRSFTDIRKMFWKMFKVLISSEALSTPTAPRVSPAMQLSCTSNSTLSWSSINPIWAAFCSSHGVICLPISLPIHLST